MTLGERFLRDLGFNFIAVKEGDDFIGVINKIKTFPASKALKSKAFSQIYMAASRGGTISEGKQKLLQIYKKEGEQRRTRRKKLDSKVYLWESICGIAQPRNKKFNFETITAEQFLEIYIQRQIKLGGTKYVTYIINNKNLALEMAERIIKLRKINL